MNKKRIALIVAVIASSIVLWAVSSAWLQGAAPFTDILAMLWPALAFIFTAAVTAVAFMLMEHAWDRVAAMLASWATFIFFWPADVWYISALPLFLAFWWFASRDIRNDLTDRRTIRISITLGQGVKLILMGSFLMVSLGFYLLPSSRSINVKAVSKSVQSSVQSVYNNPILEQQLSQLPIAAQAQFRTEVGRYVDQTVSAWLTPIKQFIPPILAFGLFLTLWSLNFILRVPGVWLGNRLFALARRTGFVKITEESVKAEALTL